MDPATIQRSSVETPAHAGEAPVVMAVDLTRLGAPKPRDPDAGSLLWVADELAALVRELEDIVGVRGRLTGRAARRVGLRVQMLRDVVEGLRSIASEIEGADVERLIEGAGSPS